MVKTLKKGASIQKKGDSVNIDAGGEESSRASDSSSDYERYDSDFENL